ncbi:MAG TPA: hypothetical protein VFN21_02040 [Acidimicrobiales bacterium]|nr:hypothetical protein [Acidimicrobiales bacterium]
MKTPFLSTFSAKAMLSATAALATVFAISGGPAGAASADPVTYTADLAAVPLNTPDGAASGHVTVKLEGDQATVTEKVSGLGDKLPTDTATLASLGIPAAFAGKPFPHVQHVHIMGQGKCPAASADANGDGVISTVEGHDSYGMIGTTLSTKGATDASTATDVTVAPGGGSFTYTRTFTMNQDTIDSLTSGKAVAVVHGLNPETAPKASLTTPNSLDVTLPGQDKKLALIGTAPAICGVLTAATPTSPQAPATMAPQMHAMPAGGAATGGGSTSGLQDEALFAIGGLLLAGGFAVLIARRRIAS